MAKADSKQVGGVNTDSVVVQLLITETNANTRITTGKVVSQSNLTPTASAPNTVSSGVGDIATSQTTISPATVNIVANTSVASSTGNTNTGFSQTETQAGDTTASLSSQNIGLVSPTTTAIGSVTQVSVDQTQTTESTSTTEQTTVVASQATTRLTEPDLATVANAQQAQIRSSVRQAGATPQTTATSNQATTVAKELFGSVITATLDGNISQATTTLRESNGDTVVNATLTPQPVVATSVQSDSSLRVQSATTETVGTPRQANPRTLQQAGSVVQGNFSVRQSSADTVSTSQSQQITSQTEPQTASLKLVVVPEQKFVSTTTKAGTATTQTASDTDILSSAAGTPVVGRARRELTGEATTIQSPVTPIVSNPITQTRAQSPVVDKFSSPITTDSSTDTTAVGSVIRAEPEVITSAETTVVNESQQLQSSVTKTSSARAKTSTIAGGTTAVFSLSADSAVSGISTAPGKVTGTALAPVASVPDTRVTGEATKAQVATRQLPVRPSITVKSRTQGAKTVSVASNAITATRDGSITGVASQTVFDVELSTTVTEVSAVGQLSNIVSLSSLGREKFTVTGNSQITQVISQALLGLKPLAVRSTEVNLSRPRETHSETVVTNTGRNAAKVVASQNNIEIQDNND